MITIDKDSQTVQVKRGVIIYHLFSALSRKLKWRDWLTYKIEVE